MADGLLQLMSHVSNHWENDTTSKNGCQATRQRGYDGISVETDKSKKEKEPPMEIWQLGSHEVEK